MIEMSNLIGEKALWQHPHTVFHFLNLKLHYIYDIKIIIFDGIMVTFNTSRREPYINCKYGNNIVKNEKRDRPTTTDFNSDITRSPIQSS